MAEEGYRPHIDEDHDLVFKVEGHTLLVDFDDRDPGYLRLMLPNLWPIEEATELQHAYVAASHACERCKMAKVFVLHEAQVWASVEFLLTQAEDFHVEVMERQIGALRAREEAFAEKMRELASEDPDVILQLAAVKKRQ